MTATYNTLSRCLYKQEDPKYGSAQENDNVEKKKF